MRAGGGRGGGVDAGRVLRRVAAAVAIVTLVVVGWFASERSALAAFVPPPNEGPVTDTSGRLSAEDRAFLAQRLSGVRDRTGYEVTIFLTGTMGDETIDDVAYKTFNAWKLGEAKKDNGVLLVVAFGDPKGGLPVRIETGKGVEGALTDLQSIDIIRTIKPALKAGDLRGGLTTGVDLIARALTSDDPGTPRRRADGRAPGAELGSKTVGFFIILVVVIAILARRRGGGGGGGFWWGGGGGFGGGGFGGGDGGWGGGGGGGGGDWGGGGSSGGGGASDSS